MNEPVSKVWKTYKILIVLMLFILILDQGTKLWIEQTPQLPLHQPPYHFAYWPNGGIEIIPDFFYLCHISNKGAAWGLLTGYGNWLSLVAIIALGAIYYYRSELALKKSWIQVCFGLFCGGILGNLVDRLNRGYVVDFFDVHLPWYRWPAFNVADASISIGVALYITYTLIFESRVDEQNSQR